MNNGNRDVRHVDRQFRLARLWSNGVLRSIAPLFSGAVVNVSAGDDTDKEGGHYSDYFCNASEYHLTNFSPGSFRGYRGRPDEHLLDLRGPVAPELRGRFDVALSHTVLEHVFDVCRAFHNTCTLSTDVVIAVVPFAQVQHESGDFGDYWRFTPTCLRQLFAENGLEVVFETCNDTPNAAVYVLSIGSRHPDRWRTAFPPQQRICDAASWIGAPTSGSIVRLRSAARRVLSYLGSAARDLRSERGDC